jgi:hypothetical protein
MQASRHDSGSAGLQAAHMARFTSDQGDPSTGDPAAKRQGPMFQGELGCRQQLQTSFTAQKGPPTHIPGCLQRSSGRGPATLSHNC